MRKNWVCVTVIILCMLVVAGVSTAQAQERPARPAAEGFGIGMFEGLDLSQEQQAKLAEIRQTMMEKIRNADTPEARREVFTQMRDKMQEVLTEEQRAKMRERLARPADSVRPERPALRGDQARPSPEARARTMDPLQLFDAIAPRLELTEEQQAKIGKLREEAIKKLLADIKAVLTDAQKERLAQAQERLRAAQTRPVREGAGARPEAAESSRPRRQAAETERPRAKADEKERQK